MDAAPAQVQRCDRGSIFTQVIADSFRSYSSPESIKPLPGVLRGGNRTLAVGAAFSLASHGEAVRQQLLQALGDSDSLVRALAAIALGMMKDAQATQPLVAALVDSVENPWEEISEVLVGMQDSSAIDPLGLLLNDHRLYVRSRATHVLRDFHHPRAAELLRASQ